MGGATLEPGAYGQLRLIVESASVVVDGVESPLAIASGSNSGIKIDLGETIEAGMIYTLVLDYDAHKSVKTTGAGYLMTPVIEVKSSRALPRRLRLTRLRPRRLRLNRGPMAAVGSSRSAR